MMKHRFWFSAALLVWASVFFGARHAVGADFFETHCVDCHNAATTEGGLNLHDLSRNIGDRSAFRKWVRIHDRIQSGEMPPPGQPQPTEQERARVIGSLRQLLIQTESRLTEPDQTRVRRLTRVEYENTIRDLFGMRLQLQERLPGDGKVHGFDRNSDALAISHVHLAKYVEAADHVLDFAICTQPKPPQAETYRISPAEDGGVSLLAAFNGGAVFLRDKQPDPQHPPVVEGIQHVDRGAHKILGMYEDAESVGIHRHEDSSFMPRFQAFSAIYPGRYRVRTSLWSYTWDQGEVKPARGTEAARFTMIQLKGNGRHNGHPSYLIGYFDAPSIDSQVHEFEWWFNPKDCLGFNVALAPVHIYHQYKRDLNSFTGPGIACDYVEVEGPLYDQWPPKAHRELFGDLPLIEFDANSQAVTFPERERPKQQITGAKNRQQEYQGDWTVHSQAPAADARRLLAAFLPKAFRRPVPDELVESYVDLAKQRLAAGDCFELAMRYAYRAALCSPDFLYHIEPSDRDDIDEFSLANRLSYFLWNSLPDAELTQLAMAGTLHQPEVLRAQVERLLRHEKSNRFVRDFCRQWLRLEDIAANDADPKLYPEASTYMQNSMVAETEAYFRELLDADLDATHLIDSDFAMLNEKLAVHYGIAGVSGSQVRKVKLPPDSPRGGLLTQASILKVTANGTTTSPVPRGAFVMERLLGQPVDPPPEDVPAIDPDVRGATTIREQLTRHRADPACAGCHAKLDPAGFALESFDVLGGFRERYRTMEGDNAPPERILLDPHLRVSFKLGPNVDPSYRLADGREFADVQGLKRHLVADPQLLATNVARQLAIYAVSRELGFRDRDAITQIVADAGTGGIRSIIHQLVQNELFHTR